MNMEHSDLAEMLKTFKTQAECIARAQALYSQETLRVTTSLGFLADFLANDEDLSSTD